MYVKYLENGTKLQPDRRSGVHLQKVTSKLPFVKVVRLSTGSWSELSLTRNSLFFPASSKHFSPRNF